MTDTAKAVTEWSTILLSAVVASATVVYAVLTYFLVRETKRLREVETEPTISVFVRPLDRIERMLEIVVKNIGRGPAYHLQWDYDNDAPVICRLRERDFNFSDLGFFRGSEYMAPGEEYRSLFGMTTDLLNGPALPALKLNVTYLNEAGRKYAGTFLIDPEELRGRTFLLGRPNDDLVQTLGNIGKCLGDISDELHHMAVGRDGSVGQDIGRGSPQ
jgi:hypothetical protein